MAAGKVKRVNERVDVKKVKIRGGSLVSPPSHALSLLEQYDSRTYLLFITPGAIVGVQSNAVSRLSWI